MSESRYSLKTIKVLVVSGAARETSKATPELVVKLAARVHPDGFRTGVRTKVLHVGLSPLMPGL
jgi:hypothetical protein